MVIKKCAIEPDIPEANVPGVLEEQFVKMATHFRNFNGDR